MPILSICANVTERRSSAIELFEERRPGGRILTLDGHPHRGQPIMLTECGGIAYDKRRAAGVEKVWGYSVVHDDEEFARHYYQLLHVVSQYRSIQRFLLHAIQSTYFRRRMVY